MTDLSIIEDDDASYLSIDQILMEEQKLTCQSRYNFLDLDFRRAKEGKIILSSIYRYSYVTCNFDI